MCSADTLTNTLILPLSLRGTLTKPASGRSCRTFINIYPVQLEDRIHWIIATLSLKRPTMHTHYRLLANRTMLPFSSHRNINKRLAQEPPVEREVTRWSSHSEAMLQASLDDVDWDMFRASSSDVSEFTDVALSFVNTLTEQATETVTIRTFSNQKPWVDRTIRAEVNHRTAAYNARQVFCRETWASTKHCAMLSDVQLELLNSDTGRELSLIFSSMILDACGSDWRPSVSLEINPPQRWEQIRCWPKS